MTAQETEHKIRAIIIEDEELARQLLHELLKRHPEVAVVGECANGFDAVKMVPDLKPDLLFLDIQMPKLDGFEVLELLAPAPLIVFCTAYDECLDEAVKRGWNSFTCVRCPNYSITHVAPENSIEAFATQRKSA